MTWKCTNTPKGENKLYSDAKGVVPSLDLRFAEGKTLNDYMTGQNLITFSRPVGANQSPGTYVDENGIIQLSSADTPRFDHNPTTGESLGLLIEESRTNLLLRSEEFNDVSAWNVINLTVNPNAATAPDGQTTADLLTETTAPNANFYITQFTSVTSATIYTFSIRCKPNGRSRLYLAGSSQAWGAGFITFDLLNNVVSGSQGWTGTISSLPNGWYSITATQTTLATGAYNLTLFLLNDSGNVTYTGDGTSGIYLWGAQLEAGSFPTSYIPTTGTALTRSADDASITGANFSSWFVQNNGSFYCKADLQFPASSGPSPIFSVDNSGANSRIASRRSNFGVRNSSSSDGIDITNFSAWNGEVKEFALTWVANDCALVDSGTLIGTDTTTVNPLSTVNQLLIGDTNSGGFLTKMGGHISRLTYFPERLPDSTLQTMTTP